MAKKTKEQLTPGMRPAMKVPYSKKIANKFEYTKNVMDYYIGASFFFDDVSRTTSGGRDLRLLYEAYNLHLPEEYFHYVTNPLNSTRKESKNWPARLRSYSIIRPNIDFLEGEFEKRPFNFVVKVNNSDSVNALQDQQYGEILKSLEQLFINQLNAKKFETNQPSEDTEPPEKIKKKYVSNWKDERAIEGEAALNVIIDDLALEEVFKRIFKDWLIAGEVYSYKGIRGNELVYERVSPLDIDYDKSPDEEYLEDGQWCVRRIFLTAADVIDNWYEELKDQDIDYIENTPGDYSFRSISNSANLALRSDEDLKRSKIQAYHVTWKYLTKIGILTYVNPMTGEEEEMEVPETYVADKEIGEAVEWFWVNEVWEGYRIAKDIYVGMRPVPVQRNRMNNMSACKLPYNGKKFSEVHSMNISIMEMGIPYETLYRILHYQMEKTIAKSKGKILLIDKNAIPNQGGWDDEKWFYWAEATGFGLMNRNQLGVDKSWNQYQVMDMGLYDHITNLIELMSFIKGEYEELVGISRQRKGETRASETATGTNNAIYQSSIISERVFSRYEEFLQRELSGLLDCSKLAWIDGKKRLYYSDDMRTTILNLDPGKYMESEFGVFVSKSPRDVQSLELVRQQVQAFAQNGMHPSTIVDVVRARSLSKLQQILREKEQESMEAQQKSAMSEQEAEERKLMIQEQFMELEGVIKERLIHTEYDRKEDVAMITATKGAVDPTPEPLIDPTNAQKVYDDTEIKKRELARKEKADRTKEEQENKKLKLKEKELKVKKEIAELQARTALKNKTSGEK